MTGNRDLVSSSPLSSLTTEDSFTTAKASPASNQPDDTFVTDHNSFDDKEQAESQSQPQSHIPYYNAKRLPPELREYCRIHLEEALPRQTIFLLNGLLSSRSTNHEEPAYCPPPSLLALLCSIIVHPDFTTRPKEPDWPQISLDSLVLLRDVLSIFGPINAGFKEATLFRTSNNSEWDSDAQAHREGVQDADERGLIELKPRHGGSTVWRFGHDFFNVVGWAFNCSVLYPERWQYWRRWLDFMLDVLEKDLYERHRLDLELGCADRLLLRDSILASYITNRAGRNSGGLRGITRALFADGKQSSLVFQEVWPKEHKGNSKAYGSLNKRKRDNVNIDQGEYGGYMDDESVHSSQASEPPTPQRTRTKLGFGDEATLQTSYLESISLRQRLFSLLSYMCYHIPDDKPLDFSDLYEEFEKETKSLPLPVFTSFISSTTSTLSVDMQVSMLQGIMFLFLPSSALSPAKVDRERHENGGISAAIVERCLLPYPANTIEAEDNAKMSILLENLLMIVWQHCADTESFSEGLADAVETGIEARHAKVNKKKTRGRSRAAEDVDADARAALEMSSMRLKWLADAIQEQREDSEMVDDE
ncbi:hypothetical protein F5Y18DRAFT_240829 [Xylariaceae sp. FL1019]|nr:hypothetical protein F5Y18DRAFT_240829 [Xylariaceae sp. FL1019]